MVTIIMWLQPMFSVNYQVFSNRPPLGVSLDGLHEIQTVAGQSGRYPLSPGHRFERSF